MKGQAENTNMLRKKGVALVLPAWPRSDTSQENFDLSQPMPACRPH
jgi:hypothetical protein